MYVFYIVYYRVKQAFAIPYQYSRVMLVKQIGKFLPHTYKSGATSSQSAQGHLWTGEKASNIFDPIWTTPMENLTKSDMQKWFFKNDGPIQQGPKQDQTWSKTLTHRLETQCSKVRTHLIILDWGSFGSGPSWCAGLGSVELSSIQDSLRHADKHILSSVITATYLVAP